MRLFNPLHLATVLFIATVVLYANTLVNGLFFDDQQFIYENAAVTSFDIPALFSRSLVDGDGRLSNYYRPILFLGFTVEYNLFENSGAIYHLTSFLLHAGSGILLFFLLLKLFKNQTVAFFSSLLFLIHPVQTEAVAYASGRGDPLSLFFVLLTVLLSLGKSRGQKIAGAISLILGLLSKETALITPGLIFISHVVLKKSLSIQALKESFLQTLPFTLIASGYFALRLTVLNFADTLNFYRGENAYTSSIFIRINEFFHLVPQYLSLIFYPKDLFMERDLTISLVKGVTIPSATAFMGAVATFLLSLRLFRKHPVIIFGFMWTVIGFIPSSGIIPINGIFYEHFLYYPSIGIFIILSYLAFLLFKNIPLLGKAVLVFLAAAFIGLLFLRTIVRNTDWKDPITFYTRTSQHVQSARIYNNLAMAYAEEDLTKEAILTYKKALMISDAYPQTHYNLANIYLRNGDLAQAIPEYKKAVEIDPYFYLGYVRLFEIYESQQNTKELEDIEIILQKLGEKNPQFKTLLQNLKKD